MSDKPSYRTLTNHEEGNDVSTASIRRCMYDMTNQTTTRLTVNEACQFYGKSDKTIRRWIKSGKVDGELVDGILYVYPDPDDDLPTTPTKDQPDQPTYSESEMEQLRSENQLLRERLAAQDALVERLSTQTEHLTQLLGMKEQNTKQMLERLPVRRSRRSLIDRMLGKSPPDDPQKKSD